MDSEVFHCFLSSIQQIFCVVGIVVNIGEQQEMKEINPCPHGAYVLHTHTHTHFILKH